MGKEKDTCKGPHTEKSKMPTILKLGGELLMHIKKYGRMSFERKFRVSFLDLLTWWKNMKMKILG